MADPKKRIEAYSYGLDPDQLKENGMFKGPQFLTGRAERLAQLYQIEQLVKRILESEAAVTVIQVPFYHDFARDVYSNRLAHPGGVQLDNEVAVILGKWKARHLTEAVLIRIMTEVFSIPVPCKP